MKELELNFTVPDNVMADGIIIHLYLTYGIGYN